MDNTKDSFSDLRSPSPLYQLSFKHNINLEKLTGRLAAGTNVGKLVAVLDTSPEQALAYVWNWVSDERIRAHRDDVSSIARLAVRHDEKKGLQKNEQIVSFMKKLPFPFRPREFVMKVIWCKLEDDEYVYAWEPINEHLNYGFHNVAVRGLSSGFMKFRWKNDSQCYCRIVQSVNNGGSFPSTFPHRKIKESLSFHVDLINHFNRDDEIDGETRDTFLALLKYEGRTYSEDEDFFVDRVQNMFEGIVQMTKKSKSEGKGKYLRLNKIVQSDQRLITQMNYDPATYTLIFMAKVVVDASLESCLSWTYLDDSRERQKIFIEQGGTKLMKSKVNNHSHLLHSVSDSIGGVFNKREYRSKIVWKSIDDDMTVIGQEPSNSSLLAPGEAAEKKKTASYQRAYLWGLTTLQKVASAGNVEKTSVETYYKEVFPSFVPPHLLKDHVARSVSFLSSMRQKFDKSFEIDSSQNLAIQTNILKHLNESDTYSEKEKELLTTRHLELDAHFNQKNVKRLYMRNSVLRTHWLYQASDDVTVCTVEGTIRAQPSMVLASLLNFEASFCQNSATESERQILRYNNAHNFTIEIHGTGSYHHSTEAMVLWSAADNAKLEAAADSNSSREAETKEFNLVLEHLSTKRKNVARLNMQSLRLSGLRNAGVLPTRRKVAPSRNANFGLSVRLTDKNSESTGQATLVKMTFVVGKGYVSSQNFDENCFEVNFLRGAQEFHQKSRALKDLDRVDGLIYGELLMKKLSRAWNFSRTAQREARVHTMMRDHEALRQFTEMHPWFPSLVLGMLSMKIKMPKNVASTMNTLISSDALQIGYAFTASLKSRKVAADAVMQWFVQYPALQELDAKYPFFYPMALTIGKLKLMEAPWGLIFRVSIGACLSVADVSTDIYAVRMFFRTGYPWFAWANLSLLIVAVSLQLLLAYLQNVKAGRAAVAYESAVVLSLLKPAIDAYRLASGHRQGPRKLFSLLNEINYSRLIDMTAESLPSAVLQTYAFVLGARKTTGAVASIAISLLAIAYNVTIITFDIDTATERRETDPSSYGLIPSHSVRAMTIFFSFSFLMSLCAVCMRVISVALLAVSSKLCLFLFVSVDYALMFGIKILANDFRYFLKLSNSYSIPASFIFRTGMKIAVDSTFLIHGRHPMELGGLYWSFNVFCNFVFAIVAVRVYSTISKGEQQTNKDDHGGSVDDTVAVVNYGFAVLIGGALVAFLTIFFFGCDKAFLSSFYSTATGKNHARMLFKSAKSDKLKAAVLDFHPSMYRNFEEDIKGWLVDNWEKWDAEKPSFFTLDFIVKIPPGLAPLAARESARVLVKKRTLANMASVSAASLALRRTAGDDDERMTLDR